MNKTTEGRVRALKQIIFDSPDIPAKTKESVALVFVMCNLQQFGIFNYDPMRMFEKAPVNKNMM